MYWNGVLICDLSDEDLKKAQAKIMKLLQAFKDTGNVETLPIAFTEVRTSEAIIRYEIVSREHRARKT